MEFPRWPFTSITRDMSPLSARIGMLIRPLENEVNKLRTLADLDTFVSERRDEALAEVTPVAARLGSMWRADVRDPRFVKLEDGTHVSVTRHYIAVRVEGDALLLGCWPSDDEGLLPSDSDEWGRSPLTIDNPLEVWELNFDDTQDRPGDLTLYTYFDLTPEEELAVATGGLDLKLLLDERVNRIQPIVDRIQDEVRETFEVTLPARLDDLLAKKRAEFTAREGVSASFGFPEQWKAPPPRLDEALAATTALAPVSIPHTPRLSAASFEDVQRTIRIWANGMERYPRAFAGLGEDPISDLLAATLNATLPAAHREVYSRGGKSDIFVKADVLGEGAGPDKVFIAETKWATSGPIVQAALNPQLFGYLTAEDTSAVLLLLLRQKDKKAAAARYLGELRKVDGYLRDEESAVAGWPLLVFENQHRVVRVCIAMVHMPRKPSN